MYRISSGAGARTGRRAALVAAAAFAAVGAGVVGTGTAEAATSPVSDASFSWALNPESGYGAYAGGCNFLSAGKAGDNGSSTYWTATTPSPGYSSQTGNVTITKPDTNGVYSQPTFATKCQGPSGSALTPATASSNRVTFSNGTGTVDPVAGRASVHWTGSFTAVFYGGLSYWSATDPTLTVNADGTGTITATLSGFASSQTGGWSTVAPVTATLATLHGVTVGASGFTVTPDYAGVAITTPSGATAQTQSGTAWGSFPQSFVDFQQVTGQSSFWYSSGGSSDVTKVASPLTVAFTTATTPPAALPESAWVIAFPLVGVAMGGLVLARRRRSGSLA